MADERAAKLQGLEFKKDEWERFFDSKQWKEVTRRGQEHADALLNRLCNMEVNDLSGIIQLLGIRARLAGVMAQGLVAHEILREIDDEIEVVSNQGEQQ